VGRHNAEKNLVRELSEIGGRAMVTGCVSGVGKSGLALLVGKRLEKA